MTLLLAVLFLANAAEPPEIAEIRQRNQAVSAQIDAKALPFSTVELNAGNHAWPQVGKYEETARYYHEWAADKPGMKDIPAKVVHTTIVGERQWVSNYLFDATGQLCFVRLLQVEGKDTVETHFFYRDGWPIRVAIDGVMKDSISPEQTRMADAMMAQAARLLEVEMAMSTIPSDPLE